jgi:hypothetical protein
MDEEIDSAAHCINEALQDGTMVGLTELCTLLGGNRDTLARTLAWLLLRDLITFVRENGRLYVKRQGTAAAQGEPAPRL